MSILSITTTQAGTTGVLPGMVRILTNSTESEILTAGFLNKAVQNGTQFPLPCLAEVATKASSTADYQVGWYQVVHVGANWSLQAAGSPGDVTLPTIANRIAIYTNTTGSLSEDAATAVNGGNIQAGLSGTAGNLISFPATAANGSLIISALNAGGAFNTTIRNSAMGQSTVYSLADIGAATGGIPVATTALRMKNVAAAAVAGGAASNLVTDAFCSSASVVLAAFQTSANAVSIQKVTAGNGSFTLLCSGDPGASTLNYVILK